MMTFQGYTRGAQIHDGPNSQIHRATRDGDGAPVILKVLKPAYPSPARLAHFKEEYQRVRRLDVPGVVEVFDLVCDQHTWAIVQEDFGGESLSKFIAGGNRDRAELLSMAIAIAEALGQVHQKNIIHKDINPSNIVYNRATKALKLIDFGLSTVLSRQHQALTSPEVLEGTFPYISPEQTGRMNRVIDYRTDFYSLGVTLYELFTGVLPFPSRDPMEIVHCHIAKQPKPPHEVCPDVPRAVSDIIMKLMEKTAESRYQSTYGLKMDLSACLAALRERGEIGELVPGRHDVSERFEVPQKLYGREREAEAILAAFERVVGENGAAGRPELLLISGPSGIGKSAVVHELHRPITSRRGYFISGKFELLHGGAPYSAFTEAFRGLVHQIFSESEARLAQVRERISNALGTNAALIVDVLPEVADIIGPQPRPQALGPTEAQNRFRRAFLSFIRVFARPEHPLVLFLDDLQRADAGSLRLLDVILRDDELGSFLFIGAYREGEVGAAHPLTSTLDALASDGALIERLRVGPLQLGHMTELVADTVGAEPSAAESLASLVHRKTGGNPLFASEFLKEMHYEGLIAFDRSEGRWRWDLARIEAKGVTDNVVDLMVEKIRRMPAATQDALRFAACVGSHFDLDTLATICEPPGAPLAGHERLAAVFELLLPALDEGFLIASSEVSAVSAGAPLVARHFRFLHDRVEQAAYALIGESERKAVHLRIARLLTEGKKPEEREARLFSLADQWNRARDLVQDPAERAALAELNLAAGRRARASLAYAAARDYLEAGIHALGEEGTRARYDLALPLHRELADAEYLIGDHGRAEALANATLELAATPVEQAEVCAMLVNHRTMMARYEDAVATARRGLALLGVELPAEGHEAAMAAELARVESKMQGRDIASLLDRPEMTDPWAQAATRLLLRAFAAAFYLSPVLYSLIIFKAINMSLDYGHPPEGSDLYSYYGHLASGVLGQHRVGYEFGTLSLRLSERTGRHDDACRASFIVANFILPWVHPLRKALPINDAGYQAGLASGELQFGGYILIYKLMNQFYEGKPIALILEALPSFLDFNKKANNQIATDIILGIELVLSTIAGSAPSPPTFRVGDLGEAEYLATCEAHKSLMACVYYQILKAQALYLHGDAAGALAASEAAEKLLPVIMGNIAVAEHWFYKALSLAAVCPKEPGEAREAILKRLREVIAKLAGFAEANPANFAHMKALAEAELCRATGSPEAIDRYEDAIEAARDNGFPQDEALGNELCGRLWMERRKERIANLYLSEAYYGYERWGAAFKLKELLARYPRLALSEQGPMSALGSVSSISGTGQRMSSTLDLMSVVKASQAISSEIVLDRLLMNLMGIILENAGAERGVLLLEERGELLVNVEAATSTSASSAGTPVVKALRPTPISHYDGIARSVVRYVLRTGRSVILSDAARQGDFTRDPYVVEREPRSVLCAPIAGRGRLIGMLYAENNLTAGAFTQDRLEVLRLLSAQIAISIENARLYNEMERKVEERTDDLRKKNGDLQAALLHLKETQAQLVEQAKMASLGQLTAGIAHEIRNPLNFVNNFAELDVELTGELFEALESDPKTPIVEVEDVLGLLRTNSQKILEHGKRADGIVTSMMQHASGGSGERQSTDVNALVDQYVNLAVHGMKGQQQDVLVKIQRDLSPDTGFVELLPQDIGRVLVNLLNNAFHAVRDRKKTGEAGYEPTVTVSTRREGRNVTIAVKDNGTGVAPNIRDMIFVPFFTTKPTGAGTGLGLSMSYDIVVQGHRGQLRLENTEEQGARFVVSLPA